jgi:hypothetical protein
MAGKHLNGPARVLAALLAALFLATAAGCSAKSASYSSYSGGAAKSTRQGLNDADGTTGGSKATAQAASSASSAARAADSRKIIRSASLNLQTLEYERTLSELESLVAGSGGYIQASRNEYGGLSASAAGQQTRSSSLEVRIPSAKLDSFLDSAGKIGRLVSKEVDGQDVTQSYYDTETRLKTLREEQTRVLALLDKATNMTDILTIEDKLSNLQSQIEQLTGELKKWDSLVDLSTVNIVVTEVHAYSTVSAPFGSQLLSTLAGSLRALGETCRIIALVLAAVLPFAVVIAAILLLVLLICRKRGRIRRLPWRRRTSVPGGEPSDDEDHKSGESGSEDK